MVASAGSWSWSVLIQLSRSPPSHTFQLDCRLRHLVVLLFNLSLPKTPSELKMQRFQAFMRSCCYHDELSFRRFFVAGRLQLSNPRCPPSGDPTPVSH